MVLIVDALNVFIRHYVVNPTLDANGEPVGGVVGFLRGLKNLAREVRPDRIVVAWDGEGGSLKRRNVYADYKAGRRPRVNREYDYETPEAGLANLKMQHARVKNYLAFLPVALVEVEGVEADDVVGYLCRHHFVGADVVVVSSDRDLWQLVDARTRVFSPATKRYVDPLVLREEVGVLPENYVLIKALAGDGSDNIPGVKGIGPKTAVKLFPALADRPTELRELLEDARARAAENPKLRAVVEATELITKNVGLMQLTVPIVSAQAVRSIRRSVEEGPRELRAFDLKVALVKDGMQLTDGDFFAVFRDVQLRGTKRDACPSSSQSSSG